jgi:hypothetical protein
MRAFGNNLKAIEKSEAVFKFILEGDYWVGVPTQHKLR